MKKAISLLLVCMLVIGIISGCAGSNERYFEYEDVLGGIKITKYTGNSSKVVVPETIDGKLVVSVGDTFSGNVNLVSLELPVSCESADLTNCSNLKYLAAPGCRFSTVWFLEVESLETLIVPNLSHWDSNYMPNLEVLDISGAEHIECMYFSVDTTNYMDRNGNYYENTKIEAKGTVIDRLPKLKEIKLNRELSSYLTFDLSRNDSPYSSVEWINGAENAITITQLGKWYDYSNAHTFSAEEYNNIILQALGYDELKINGVVCKK